jgi:hypothetical protein
MKKATYYTYLGNNGTLTTEVYLEGIFSVKKYMIAADPGKRLTKDGKKFHKSALIPAADLELWHEVDE